MRRRFASFPSSHLGQEARGRRQAAPRLGSLQGRPQFSPSHSLPTSPPRNRSPAEGAAQAAGWECRRGKTLGLQQTLQVPGRTAARGRECRTACAVSQEPEGHVRQPGGILTGARAPARPGGPEPRPSGGREEAPRPHSALRTLPVGMKRSRRVRNIQKHSFGRKDVLCVW